MTTTLNTLSKQEAHVILHKGTEPAGSGEYLHHKGLGTYLCRQCDAPLYRSEDKFDSHCGWPAFDTAIPGKVRETLDVDGRRTEISCENCGGHLGHVFVGERMTDTNTRHCVNSLSMRFVPDLVDDPGYQVADFGMGHFWIAEAIFAHVYGVIQTHVGYMGGWKDFPSYEDIRRGDSGHYMVVRVIFDPCSISFEQLLDIFSMMYHLTDDRRQGLDGGSHYLRSVIFYHGDEQQAISMTHIDTLRSSLDNMYETITTRIKAAQVFRRAENYHQHYYRDYSDTFNYQNMIAPALQKLQQQFPTYYRK